jgi:hypothetical protein
MRSVAKAGAKGCTRRPRVQLRMQGVSDRRRKQAVSRHGGRRPESRLHHPFTGMVKERLWPCGSSQATSSKGGGARASGDVRKHSLDGSSVERPAAFSGREAARQRVRISSRRMVSIEGAHRRQGTSEVGEVSW